MNMLEGCTRRAVKASPFLAALAALWLAGSALAAESPPAPPYYTVQLDTIGSRDKALAAVKALAAEPAARAEKRSNGYVIRFGAWADKAPADAGLAKYKAAHKAAKVMYVTKPSDWILASGETLAASASAKPAAAEPAAAPAAGTPAARPAEAVAPPAEPVVVDDDTFRAAAQRLDAALRGWVQKGLARGDDYVYGMDVAAVLLYAAQRKDAGLYDAVSPTARQLVLAGDDAATQGFVLWRKKEGSEPEVSGSTEALWMARALWTGAKAFGKADDRTLALQVLDGYARHARDEGAAWHVSKYYAFGTQTFAPLSVLPNYRPDFVEEAEPSGSKALRGVARRSYSLLQRAVTPSKLLVPLIQPDLNEVLPGLNVNLYAPNGVVVLEDSCGAAEGALRGVPALARNLLAFIGKPERHDANGRLFAYYHRKDGHPIGEGVLSSAGYACLARLAVAQKDKPSQKTLKGVLAGDMKALAEASPDQGAPLYGAAELLLAADALKAL